MSLYLVRAVCLALEVDEVVESLFALLDLICKSLLAPFVHINDIAAETCDIAFHLFKCGCSFVILKFCTMNKYELAVVLSFLNLLLVFRPPIFSIRSKDFLHVTGNNLIKKEQEMQALFACFPALFIILLQYTGTPPAHCNSYAVFFLEKIPFNLSIYGFVHGIFPSSTNNVQMDNTIVIG